MWLPLEVWLRSPTELLPLGPDLLCSGSEVLCSCRPDLLCSCPELLPGACCSDLQCSGLLCSGRSDVLCSSRLLPLSCLRELVDTKTLKTT